MLLVVCVGGGALGSRDDAADATLLAPPPLSLRNKTRGRLTVFDGRLLHSVVPGRGSAPAGARRTTFMVAFWDAVDVRPGDGPGAARPAPPRALAVPPRKAGRGRGGGGEGRGAARRVEPREVRPVWETMDGREARGPLRPYDACWAGC